MHSDPTKLVNFWSGDVLKSETVHFCSLFFIVGKIYLKHSLKTYHQHRGFCYRCRSDFFFHFLSKLVMLLEKTPGSFWTRCKSVCLEVPEYWNIFNRSISTLRGALIKIPLSFHSSRASHLKCNMLFLQNGVFVCFLHVYMHNTYVIFYWDFHNWKMLCFCSKDKKAKQLGINDILVACKDLLNMHFFSSFSFHHFNLQNSSLSLQITQFYQDKTTFKLICFGREIEHLHPISLIVELHANCVLIYLFCTFFHLNWSCINFAKRLCEAADVALCLINQWDRSEWITSDGFSARFDV